MIVNQYILIITQQERSLMDNTFYSHIFRFYSKSLTFPYTELGLELQHLFRQMEVLCQNELEEQLAGHTLEILNYFQGEEMSTMQGEYSRMFAHVEGEDPLLAIHFTAYGNPGDADQILDHLFDSSFDVTYDEAPDSVINLLDYYCYLAEADDIIDKLPEFASVIENFSQSLYQVSNINFYKEVAKGLHEMAKVLAE